jgi:uncharacterized protein
MKKIYSIVAGLLVLLALAAAGCTADGGGQKVTVSMPQLPAVSVGPGIIWSQQNVGLWVSGEGKVSAAPDIALLSLGVQVQMKTVAEAQRQAADAMSKVMSVVKGKGVADKDIQTQGYNISQVTRWDDKNSVQVVIGYNVSNTMVIKVRKLEDTGSIVDAVSGAAGDYIRINNIGFTIDDPTNYQKQAREKAVKDAMEKAKQIASLSGVKLGKILYITESIPYTPGPVLNFSKMDAAGAAPAPVTPISSGELTVTVNVQMVYDTD